MFKSPVVIIFLTFLLSSCASNKGFVAENISGITQSHRTIAILPFKVSFNETMKMASGRRTKNAVYWQEQERVAGLDMQQAMFISLAKMVEKGKMEKIIQDFTRTNKLLESSGISFQRLFETDMRTIADILEVDAVLFGDSMVEVDYSGMMMGGMNNGTTTKLSIIDAASSQVIWTQSVNKRPTSQMDTPKTIAQQSTNDLSRMLPYRLK
ncbi:hypothetical protein SAMN06298216_1173 [Spirosomataceae bacterium TFI 002]|nr:hypothetical protein SAMN06298216_1173 [Spirosomataceae bacterium TFI 002]